MGDEPRFHSWFNCYSHCLVHPFYPQLTVNVTHFSDIMPYIRSKIRIRHPGYDDSNNVLLELYAYDHPNGGIHYETACISCGILAGNRWDGILTLHSEYRGESPPSNGILIGEDCYFHLLDWQAQEADHDKQAARRYPITCRLEEWIFPHGDLPQIWQDCLLPPAPEAKGINSSNVNTLLAQIAQLGSMMGEEIILEENELEELKDLASQKNAAIDPCGEVCQLCGQIEDRDFYSLCGAADSKWIIRNNMLQYLSEPVVENEDKATDTQYVKEILRSSTNNRIWLGDNCQAERHSCDLISALYLGQYSFAPKYEHEERSVMVATLFAPGDESRHDLGICNARDNSLYNSGCLSIEMLFVRFALNVFWNLDSFLIAKVQRKLVFIDHTEMRCVVDASATLCELLTVRMGALDEYSQDHSNRVTDQEWPTSCGGCGMVRSLLLIVG